MFDRSGKLVKSFGKGLFLQPHGLHVDPGGDIWVTDSGPFYAAGQTPGKGFQVFKFTPEGKLLTTLGKAGVGVAGDETFVGPTDVAVNARGEIFVADGHTPRPGTPDGDGIVKLSREGRFIKAWGRTRVPRQEKWSDRIASRSTHGEDCSSPTAATAASGSSIRKAPSSTSGRSSAARAAFGSTSATPCMSRCPGRTAASGSGTRRRER
jgi:hypothetical protein